jgi:predicted RNase H-like nuclease (RuvC/YqgF family)
MNPQQSSDTYFKFITSSKGLYIGNSIDETIEKSEAITLYGKKMNKKIYDTPENRDLLLIHSIRVLNHSVKNLEKENDELKKALEEQKEAHEVTVRNIQSIRRKYIKDAMDKLPEPNKDKVDF